MIAKKQRPPTTQRVFRSPWSELDYLCKKIHYWLYTRKEKPKADRYVGRLKRVLGEAPENDLAIIRHEGLALFNELMGDLSKSILHRKREIELIERLQQEAQLPSYDEDTRAYMLQDLGAAALQQRRGILSRLKQEIGISKNGVRKTNMTKK